MTNKRKLKRVRNSQSKAIKASDKRRRRLIFDKAVKLFGEYDPSVLFIGGIIGGIGMICNRSRIVSYTRASALLNSYQAMHGLV